MTKTEKYTGFKHLGFDYWVFFLLVLMMGRGTDFLSVFDPRLFPLSFLGLIITTCILAKKARNSSISINKFIVLIPIIAWTIYHYFEDYEFEYYSYSYFLIKVYIGCLVVQHYGARIIEYYGKIVALLAGISIPFWIVANIIGLDALASFAPFKHSLGAGSSFIIYVTLEKYNMGDTSLLYALLRNAGFAWEPGRFASMVVLGMVCYIIQDEGKINWRKKEWLFMIVALLSTQSTTGYVSFLIMLGIHYLTTSNLSTSKRVLSIIMFFAFYFSVMNLPFMQEKIKDNADSETWVTEKGDYSYIESEDIIVTVDRTEGIFLDYLNLQYKPILGTGLSHKDTYLYNFISQNLTTSNGLTNPLSRLGLLLGLPLFILFFIGTRKMSKEYSANDTMLLFTISMIFQYSYNFMFEIIILSFVLYGLSNKLEYKNA